MAPTESVLHPIVKGATAWPRRDRSLFCSCPCKLPNHQCVSLDLFLRLISWHVKEELQRWGVRPWKEGQAFSMCNCLQGPPLLTLPACLEPCPNTPLNQPNPTPYLLWCSLENLPVCTWGLQL